MLDNADRGRVLGAILLGLTLSWSQLILEASAQQPARLSAVPAQAGAPAGGPAAQPESLKVKIKEIRITGNTAITTQEFEPLLSPYLGKELDLAELKRVADQITEEYRSRGYNLARAIVPEQDIKEGIVVIRVLEATVGEIKIQGNQYFSTDYILGAFKRVQDDKAVKQASLEKTLLLLNDSLDIKATAALQAGADPGTTDIIVTIQDRLPIHYSFEYNNFGVRAVARDMFNQQVDIGDPWFGSYFSVRGSFAIDPLFSEFRRLAYTLPLNNYGTKLNFAYGLGSFDVGGDLAELELSGQAEGWGFSLTHPFLRSRFHTLIGEIGFDVRDTTLFVGLTGSRFSRDRIRLVRLGLTYDGFDSTGRTLAAVNILHGLGDTFAGMKAHNSFSSRLDKKGSGADGEFTYATISMARFQRIFSFLSLLLRTSGHISSSNLVASEQFSIGGPDTVRGYAAKELVADEGFNASSELRLAPIPDSDLLQFALFLDYGLTHNREPVPGVQKFHSLLGYGTGVRLRFPINFDIRFDVGFPITPQKNSIKRDQVYYLQVSLRY